MVFADIDRSKIDDCLYYLLEADHFYRELVEIHPYDVLFESEQGKEAEAHNNQVIKKTKGSLRKAVDALIALIKNIGEMVSNFIREVFMSGEEHKRYEAYKRALQENPELRNCKVTVKDFREYEKYYDSLINQVDQKIREVKGGKETDIEKFIKEISAKSIGDVSRAAKVITLDALLNICANSKEYAQHINKQLKENEAACEAIRKTLGDENTNKYLKDVDMYATSKLISLKRIKANLYRKKCNTMKECLTSSLKSAESIMDGKITNQNKFIVDNLSKNDSAVGDAVKIATSPAKRNSFGYKVNKNAEKSFGDKIAIGLSKGIDPTKKNMRIF